MSSPIKYTDDSEGSKKDKKPIETRCSEVYAAAHEGEMLIPLKSSEEMFDFKGEKVNLTENTSDTSEKPVYEIEDKELGSPQSDVSLEISPIRKCDEKSDAHPPNKVSPYSKVKNSDVEIIVEAACQSTEEVNVQKSENVTVKAMEESIEAVSHEKLVEMIAREAFTIDCEGPVSPHSEISRDKSPINIGKSSIGNITDEPIKADEIFDASKSADVCAVAQGNVLVPPKLSEKLLDPKVETRDKVESSQSYLEAPAKRISEIEDKLIISPRSSPSRVKSPCVIFETTPPTKGESFDPRSPKRISPYSKVGLSPRKNADGEIFVEPVWIQQTEEANVRNTENVTVQAKETSAEVVSNDYLLEIIARAASEIDCKLAVSQTALSLDKSPIKITKSLTTDITGEPIGHERFDVPKSAEVGAVVQGESMVLPKLSEKLLFPEVERRQESMSARNFEFSKKKLPFLTIPLKVGEYTRFPPTESSSSKTSSSDEASRYQVDTQRLPSDLKRNTRMWLANFVKDLPSILERVKEPCLYEGHQPVRVDIPAPDFTFAATRTEPIVVNKFQVILDISQFDRQNIYLHIVDDKIDVYATQENESEYGVEFHGIHKVFPIPKHVNRDGFTACITEEHFLIIEASPKDESALL